jgi:ketopantoate reductase
MRALIVGAGAVGQVYGYHLHLGGAEVAFFVKPKYAESARAGFTLYSLNDRRRRTAPQHWRDYDVVTSAAEVRAERWDMVLITVSSPALRGPWLPELTAAIGDATLVILQPGIDDRAVALEAIDASRLVQGLISLISYFAPLPGETRFPEPGCAYWFPPLSPSPFSGPEPRVSQVVDALRAGGFPAKRHPDLTKLSGFPNAVLMSYLSALESAGWTFRGLRQGPHLGHAAAAAREALAVVERQLGVKKPALLGIMAKPLAIRTGLWLGRRVVPLDLETYFRVHFTKVGDQTRMAMARFIELAREGGLEARALESLTASLPALPPAPGKAVASS